MILVSPTEPKLLIKSLRGSLNEQVKTSSLPETMGADIAFRIGQGWAGLQRKAFPADFLASVSDGRFQREMNLLQTKTEVGILLVEGSPTYTSEGLLMGAQRAQAWQKRQLRNLFRSVWLSCNVAVEITMDLDDTCEAIVELVDYLRKDKHYALSTRPKPKRRDTWGDRSVLAEHLFFLQGLPGVGPSLAEAMLQTLGRLPLTWACSKGELGGVPGLGKRRLESLWKYLT